MSQIKGCVPGGWPAGFVLWFGLLGSQGVVAATYDCLIEPTQMVDVASPVTGLLSKVMVKRGDRVTKGQVLATLESQAEQASADLAKYKSELLGPTQLAESKATFAEKKFSRRRDMAAENLMSTQERDDAEAEYRLAQAELKTAQENRALASLELRQQTSLLSLRTIRSPFDGVVADQMVYPGEVVEPGSENRAILKLAQINPLRVRVIMPSMAFGKPKVGMTAGIVPEISGNVKYSAKVKSIDRLIDAASGTFIVFLDLPNSNVTIPSGVRCKATFDSPEAAPVPAVTKTGSNRPAGK